MEVERRLIVGERVSQAANDKQELGAVLQAIPPPVGAVEPVLTGSGFYSEEAVRAVEQTAADQPSGTTVYAAMERKNHHRSVADLQKQAAPAAPPAGASVRAVLNRWWSAPFVTRIQTCLPTFITLLAALSSILE